MKNEFAIITERGTVLVARMAGSPHICNTPAPDGYASLSAATVVYDEHGVPDSYAALRPQQARTTARRTPTTVIRDTAGIPDGYATAIKGGR